MVAVFQNPITAEDIKAKARALGADLVGIADGQLMNDNPPDPKDPRRPSDITDYDADRVIVLAKRLNSGTTRISRWDERHKYYNDEITISMLEEIALDLVQVGQFLYRYAPFRGSQQRQSRCGRVSSWW